jgi:biotin-dependent carboxylase-like uncharacterized protein
MIKVLKSGLFTNLQDAGRLGFQSYGIPISGPMDKFSFDLANKILNNSLNSSALEITMTGPLLEFYKNTLICITGADISPRLNDIRIENNKIIEVKPKDRLSFGALVSGFRAYLGVLGGFKSNLTHNSSSMCFGVTKHVRLVKNDTLNYQQYDFPLKEQFTLDLIVNKNANHLKVYKGPEYDLLNDTTKKVLFSNAFSLSNTFNRMAIQLNEKLYNQINPIITSPVLPGTIQLTPNGTLIVLMRDCQTTGGYPRILQLDERSINTISQYKKDSSFYFSSII